MRILAIDPNTDRSRKLEAWVRSLGYEIRTYTNGLSALGDMDVFSPDIVIHEALNPVLTGPEIIMKLRARGMRNPILSYSGTASQFETLECKLVGGTGTLEFNPYSISEELKKFK